MQAARDGLDYWADLATGWLEEGAVPPPDLAAAITEAAANRRVQQHLRHRLRRLLRPARRT